MLHHKHTGINKLSHTHINQCTHSVVFGDNNGPNESDFFSYLFLLLSELLSEPAVDTQVDGAYCMTKCCVFASFQGFLKIIIYNFEAISMKLCIFHSISTLLECYCVNILTYFLLFDSNGR